MQLATERVTRDDLLRHAVLILEHAFRYIDARPLPGGQATVIVDLAGTALPDAAPLLRLALLARPLNMAAPAYLTYNKSSPVKSPAPARKPLL